MKALSKSDSENKELMVKFYRYQWNMMEINSDLSKEDACARTLTENGFKRFRYIENNCFLCEYMIAVRKSKDFECDLCPIKWLELDKLVQSRLPESAPCENSYYGKWLRKRIKLDNTSSLKFLRRAWLRRNTSKLAGVISRLPEKEGL